MKFLKQKFYLKNELYILSFRINYEFEYFHEYTFLQLFAVCHIDYARTL